MESPDNQITGYMVNIIDQARQPLNEKGPAFAGPFSVQ
jgi:hypothetical protein